MYTMSREIGSPSMIEFMLCVHVASLTEAELRLLGAQNHLVAVALAGEFRASRQPACEHAYAAGKRAYDDTQDLTLAIIVCNHDDIEDSNGRMTFETLCEKLNPEIALSVQALTKPDDIGLSEDAKLELLVRNIKKRALCDWRVAYAKACDSWHNNITADDFIHLAQTPEELSKGIVRRRRCFEKTRRYYLPLFAECEPYIPDKHKEAYKRIVAEIDQISREGLLRNPPQQLTLTETTRAVNGA